MEIRYTGIIKELTGKEAEEIDLSGETTVLELLERLSRHHGRRFELYLFDPELKAPKEYLQFFVDGSRIESLDGFQTKVANSSVLTISFRPVIGG